MAVETKEVLKEHFQTGDKPTGNQFENLIDSIRHINDNEYGDFTTSGVISSSKGEGGGFGLKIHSASFNYISASTGDFDANTIRIGGSSFSKTNVDEVKDIETKRKSDIGIPMKRLRAFGSASTFVDLNAAGVVPSGHSSARSGFTKGESIDIFVKDTYEAFHVDPYLISVGAKANLPLELTGSLKISPSYSDPHDLKGKYKFSGNPDNFGSAGTGIEISGSLDLSGSSANYSFENMSMDIFQGGQLTYGALGVSMTGNSNVTIEEAVITQPGIISQSFNIGTSTSPSLNTMTGIGDNCYIMIAEGVTITVNPGSTFTIQCPQPDVTVNTDTDIITLSNGTGDETVISTGEFGTNPQFITTNYNVPPGNAAVWYGPIKVGTTPEGISNNLGSLRLNTSSQIRIQVF